MLYRTHHHPSFSPFNPFTSPTTISPHPPKLSLPSQSSASPNFIQVGEQGMECAEGALKSSFRPEMAVKTTATTNHVHAPHQQQPVSSDDFLTANGHAQGGFLADDFFVDDFLDLSTGFAEDKEEEENREHENNDNKKGCSVSVAATAQQQQQVKPEKNSSFCEFGSLPSSELSVPAPFLPAEDLADLEWLSHFVDDSFPVYPLTYPAGKSASVPQESRQETRVPVESNPCFTTPVQTKARSKRTKTGGRVWSLSSPSLTESSTSSSSSTSSNSSPLSSQANSWLIYTSPSQTAVSFLGKPPVKKQKKKKQGAEESGVVGSGSGGGAQQPRRCSHCGVQKTPQWRAGPLGAKTLCNACGVRYKSGRLLPEYRPACSPTFSGELHSNNHRKVLEMRRKKELEAGLAPPVQSF